MSTSLLLSQQKPEANIKVQSSNVVVDLIVTDRHGHHVPGLSIADFTIYEDGVSQRIVGFAPPSPSGPVVTATTPPSGQNDNTKFSEQQVL